VHDAAGQAHDKAGEYTEKAQDTTDDLTQRGQVCVHLFYLSILLHGARLHCLQAGRACIMWLQSQCANGSALRQWHGQWNQYECTQFPHAAGCCLQRGAKEAGKQAGDAAHQGADFAADKTQEAGAAAEDYSKTGADKVVGFSSYLSTQGLA
jgi:hypothetical protein